MNLFFLLLINPVFSLVLHGINFYGFETNLADTTCSWKYPIDFYLDQLVTIGFNSIRLPFSYAYVTLGDFSKMDAFIESTTNRNMTILLDFHRVFSGYQTGNPFDDLSMTEFVECWNTVLDRYVDNDHVTSVGLFNEFQGTANDGNYWNEMMKQAIQLIEYTQPPKRWVYFVGGTNWSGNLETITLEGYPFSDRIRYEIHKYHFSGHPPDDWDLTFGRFTDKVVVGEWAINRDDWDDLFIDYLIRNNIQDTYYWTVSNSHDTINLWEDDCETINEDVLNKIKKLWNYNYDSIPTNQFGMS